MNFGVVLLLAASLDWVTALGGRVDLQPGSVTVSLRGAWVTDTDLELLAAQKDLTHIDLSLTRVTDLGLLRLKDLPNVREMNLFFAELVTDEGLAAMRGWNRIERLNLRGTKVTDNTLALLAGKDSIVALDIGYAEVTDSGLQHLPRLTNLRDLALGGNKMTEIGLEVLRSLPKLTRLDIAGRQRTDSGLWYVAATDTALDPVVTLKQLRDLNLAGTQISSRGVRRLAELPVLERLNLNGAKRVTDEAAAYLVSMKPLRWVDLKDTAMTAQGFAKLRTARPDLQIAGDPANEPIERLTVEMENEALRITSIRLNPGESLDSDLITTRPSIYIDIQGGGVRMAQGDPAAHAVTNPGRELSWVVRVELNQDPPEALPKDQRFEPVTLPTSADSGRVLFENKSLRVTRLSCPSRASCPANERAAVDVTLGAGKVVALRPSAPARYNETPLPLDLVRIEVPERVE